MYSSLCFLALLMSHPLDFIQMFPGRLYLLHYITWRFTTLRPFLVHKYIYMMSMVCWSLTSLCHSNGHIETMPAREINPFTALTRIRSQFLMTQWSTSNHQRMDTTTPQTAHYMMSSGEKPTCTRWLVQHSTWMSHPLRLVVHITCTVTSMSL